MTMKDQLYLLRPGFYSDGRGPLYCGDSAPVEGLLSFFPQLRERLEVHYLEFARPRSILVRSLGDEHQSLPALVLSGDTTVRRRDLVPRLAKGKRFFAEERVIRSYLTSQYDLPEAS